MHPPKAIASGIITTRPQKPIVSITEPTEVHVLSRIAAGDNIGRLAKVVGNLVSRWVRESQPVLRPVQAGPFWAHRIESAAELRNDARTLVWRPVYKAVCRY